MDPARHPGRPGSLSRPVHQRPAPRTTPHYPHHSEKTGQQEGARAPDQHGTPADPLGRESVYPKEKSSAGGSPEHIRQAHPEHVTVAGPDTKAGDNAYRSATPPEKSPARMSTSAAPGVGLSNT
ncbi:MAG: hypothetical protein M3317_12325, partial [Actinomycetota bacterium]|nr:hypothetical protein [Actinomycetota bacterium]